LGLTQENEAGQFVPPIFVRPADSTSRKKNCRWDPVPFQSRLSIDEIVHITVIEGDCDRPLRKIADAQSLYELPHWKRSSVAS
jgi:hypothetical protein